MSDYEFFCYACRRPFSKTLTPGEYEEVSVASEKALCCGCAVLCDRNLRIALLLEDKRYGHLRHRQPEHSAGCDGSQAVRVHVPLVRVCGGRECDHPRVFLEKCRTQILQIRGGDVRAPAAAVIMLE